MPIHDWTRVTSGTFHAFHLAWIAEIQRALNDKLLPDTYYALAEQVANDVIPDVLTLQERPDPAAAYDPQSADHDLGGVAVAEAPPRVALEQTIVDPVPAAAKRRRLVIRHTTGDRIVAFIEIVSPGNKERRPPLDSFVSKAVTALRDGFQLLILDLFPPGQHDSTGIHGAIWNELGGDFTPPPGKPLTLAAYAARQGPANSPAAGAFTAYVEPTAVAADLIDMPLFLNADHYVNVPLEPTYRAAYEGLPKRWKQVLEAT